MFDAKEKTHPDYFAIRSAANELRARAIAEFFGKISAGLAAWFKRHVIEPARARARRQRELDELLHLDDRMLRDLGLSRGGIVYAFEHGREDEPANTNTPASKTPRAA
jgi:uncharacterized protein YjiS (DUF1127 family)